MPSPDDARRDAVRSELTDVLVQVVDCAPEDVVDSATLKKLGVDSLGMVEMADELGRRFDVFIPDDTVNGLQTVADAVAAVAHLEDDAPRSSTDHQKAAPVADAEAATEPPVSLDADGRMSAMKRLALWFAAVGAAVGIMLGFGGSVFVGATFTESDLPPLTLPTTPAPTTATPTPTPTPEPSEEETPDPDPTLTIANTQVSPGERFTLEGRFPGMKGETLQVEVKAPGEKWDAFPVTARTRGGGVYRTQIYTTRTGEREFRMAHLGSNKTTPAVSVRIG